MTPRDVYADVVAFIDGYTADVPPDIGLRMVRSYASNLATPGESLLDRDNECVARDPLDDIARRLSA